MSDLKENVTPLNGSDFFNEETEGMTTSVSYESHSGPSKCNALLGTSDDVKVGISLIGLTKN